MRLFIAVPIPEEIKEYLISVQDRFSGFPLRFVKPEQMHLTIDFLGEIPDSEVDGIIKDLGRIHSKQFKIRLTGLGTFPSKEKIRVLWIGIEKDETFIQLQKDIRRIFNHRRKFMPHLTLARARYILKDQELSCEVEGFKTLPQEFFVDRFILFRSEPTPEGHVHSIVRKYDLG